MTRTVSLAVTVFSLFLVVGTAQAQNATEHSLDNVQTTTQWYGSVFKQGPVNSNRTFRHTGLGPKPRASCGWYMRGVFGGRYGPAYNRAYAWAKLPKVAPRPGAVVVSSRKGRGCGGPCGHVVKIVRVIDACKAIVRDNRGTYERNICRNQVAVVQP